MTLLTVVRDVCADVGVLLPTSVFSGITNNRTMQEMLALANEVAQQIAYDSGRDWQKLQAIATIPGDGTATAFDLPANFKRLLLTSEVWNSANTGTPMLSVADINEWIVRRNANRANGYGEWILLGGQILIQPAMGVDTTATFAYMHKNCVTPEGGGANDTFLSDNDSFALDERLFKLGMIWRWKAKKGAPYAEDLGTYTDALAMLMGADKPAPTMIGHLPISANTRVSYPWPVPS